MNEQPADRHRHSRPIPFHPVVFAVAPILFLYAYNGPRIPIDPRELLLPLALSLAMTVVLWAIVWLLLRSATRAALVVSLFLVLFFSYGHVAGAYEPAVYASAELLLCWAVLLGGGIWLVARRPRRRTRGSFSGLTVALNSIAVGIVAVNLVTGARAFTNRPPHAERASVSAKTPADAGYPDIYYIITDSYDRSDVLRSRYQTDNSAFLNELRRRGFFVADRARSNYASTYPSLASSLNFTYLDSVARAVGPEAENTAPLVRMIQDSRLVDFLRRRGYTIVTFSSGFAGTELASADVHFSPRWSLSEFQGILVNTTLLRDVLILMHKSLVDRHRERVLYTLRNLPDAGLGRHPVFVFAHILSPHRPFVFRVFQRPGVSRHAAGYGGQVTYLDSLLEGVVRRILAQSSRPPVILIQGDHGLKEPLNWGDSAYRQLHERHAILYAAYLPPSGRPVEPSLRLYDSISPVNTFRVVLSTYFDTTMPLLPDRSYYSLLNRPYHFYDVDRPEAYPATGSLTDPNDPP